MYKNLNLKVKAFAFLALCLSSNFKSHTVAAQAAGCSFSVDTAKWFYGTAYNVAWNPAGNKVLVSTNGNTSGLTTAINYNIDHVVLNVTDTSTGMYPYAPMTVNTGGADQYGSDAFTPNGGAIYDGTDSYTYARYQKPGGGFTALSASFGMSQAVIYGIGVSLDRDTTVFYVYNGSTGLTSVGYLNDSDPQNPVAGILPITVNYYVTGGTQGSNLATMGNRIYYERYPSAFPSENSDLPRVIKCVDFSGAVCPNWTDVTLSTGGSS